MISLRYHPARRLVAIQASDPGITGLGWVIVGPDHAPEWVARVSGDGWCYGAIVRHEDAAKLLATPRRVSA